MGATLLSCVLLLLWPPSARADVLVQPDFDANKVGQAPVLCHVGGRGGVRAELPLETGVTVS